MSSPSDSSEQLIEIVNINLAPSGIKEELTSLFNDLNAAAKISAEASGAVVMDDLASRQIYERGQQHAFQIAAACLRGIIRRLV